MVLFLIVFSSLIACLKVTVQGKAAKRFIKNDIDSVVFNCLVFGCIMIAFFFRTGGSPEWRVLPYSLIFGLGSMLFQYFYTLALKNGPVSISGMICNLSMLIPIAVSLLFFNEQITPFRIAGMVLCAVSLLLSIKDNGKKANRKWLFFITVVFIANGAIASVNKIFGKSQWSNQINSFIFFSYLSALTFSVLLLVILGFSGQKISFPFNFNGIGAALSVAALLGLFQYVYTYANTVIDGIVLVPAYNGLTTVLLSLSGLILFRERLSAKQYGGVFTGICSVILMSIN